MCDTYFIIIVIAASYQLYLRTGSCRTDGFKIAPTGGRDVSLTFLATTAIAFFGGLFAWYADAVR